MLPPKGIKDIKGPRAKGIRDIKGPHAAKGVGGPDIGPDHPADPEKGATHFQFESRFGKISFSDIIQGIGSVIDLVAKMAEEGKKEEKREVEFSSPAGSVKAVFGLSVKQGIGGTPEVETFGNVKRATPRPVVEEEREPLVDIFDEEDHVSVIVELPGVQMEDIHTEFSGDILILSAANSHYKYYKEVLLPKDVDVSSTTSKYKNGVLEVKMNKRRGA